MQSYSARKPQPYTVWFSNLVPPQKELTKPNMVEAQPLLLPRSLLVMQLALEGGSPLTGVRGVAQSEEAGVIKAAGHCSLHTVLP